VALTVLQPPKTRLQHFGSLHHLKITLHNLAYGEVFPFPSKGTKQVISSQDPDNLPILLDRKILLRSRQDQFNHAAQRVFNLERTKISDHSPRNRDAAQGKFHLGYAVLLSCADPDKQRDE